MDSFTKEEFRNFFIGICVAAAFLLTIIIVKLENNIWQGAEDSDYTVYATFNHTDGLVIGDKVRMAGIDIGYVAASVLDDDFRATLTLKIHDDILIPDDSSASIVSFGVMGTKYIEIEPGGSEEYLSDGDDFSYTQDAIILQELVDRIISLGKSNHHSAIQTETEQKSEE